MGCQTAILAGGNYGGIFLEIWGRFAWVAEKQYWREETMGEIFLEIWGGFAWVAKKQYWREETMGEFF